MPYARRVAALVLPILIICALPVPRAADAQAPVQAPTPARAGKVFLTGENPWIELYAMPGGPTVTEVSFWRIHWSPVGAGHVCLVTIDPGKAGGDGALRVALYDNAKLFAYLTRDVLGSYNKTYVDRPFTPVAGATFAAGGDGITERRETCRSDKYTIELAWHDLREPQLMDILPGTRAKNPFGITWLRIPASRATVTINGKPAPGTSVPGEPFLAFGETWIK